MVRHVVMWTFKDENKQANLEKAREMLLALKDKIAQVRSLDVGLNELPGTEAYDIVLSADFDSYEDLDVYQKHPAHVEAGAFIKTVRGKRASADYTF